MDADKMTYAECVDYARYLHWQIGAKDWACARGVVLGLLDEAPCYASVDEVEAAREFSWACIDKYRLRPGPSDTE